MPVKQKILFITGSMNQTSQMHQIAQMLPEFDCWFSQLFTDSKWMNFLIKHTTWGNGTILTGQFRENSEKYLADNGLQMDYGARKNDYSLIVYCTDLIIPGRMQKKYTVWVQEGMIDRATWVTKLVKLLHLPPYLPGNTSLNGSTNRCDVYCAASGGYKQHFAANGTDPSKIIVTGMPNYDNLQQYRDNSFPHRNYVMVATTDLRETLRFENRVKFIKKAIKIADGRQLLFKLHPNENFERAEREIKKHAPANTLIYRSGNTNEMIANCAELITQYSTVVFTGIALGKKVYSLFKVDKLEKLSPLQNGGTSAKLIADICRNYLNRVADFEYIGADILNERTVPKEELLIANNY